MAEKAQTLTRRQVEEKIVARAWTDEDFRRKLLADPKGLFEELTGMKLPASLKLSAHQEDENNLYFVLPPKVKPAELSDADLEKVAGGLDTVVVCATIAAGIAVVPIVAGMIANANAKNWS